MLNGLFPLMVDHLQDYLSGIFPYALHVKRSGCQAQNVLARHEQEDAGTVVHGSVAVEAGIEEDVTGHLLGGILLCRLSSMKGLEVFALDEVGKLSMGCRVRSCKAVQWSWFEWIWISCTISSDGQSQQLVWCGGVQCFWFDPA